MQGISQVRHALVAAALRQGLPPYPCFYSRARATEDIPRRIINRIPCNYQSSSRRSLANILEPRPRLSRPFRVKLAAGE